jgi:hypothetical protein
MQLARGCAANARRVTRGKIIIQQTLESAITMQNEAQFHVRQRQLSNSQRSGIGG